MFLVHPSNISFHGVINVFVLCVTFCCQNWFILKRGLYPAPGTHEGLMKLVVMETMLNLILLVKTRVKLLSGKNKRQTWFQQHPTSCHFISYSLETD